MSKSKALKCTPKLIVQLNGGLGNQMFQYACARSLALRNGLELVLDDWSGFFRDFQYRRSYELGALPIKAELIKTLERLPIWLNRFLHRPRHSHSSLLEEYWYGQFIHETEFAWIPTLNDLLLNRNTWITGYWQSPLYFSEHSKLICTELMPPQPRNHFFILMAKLIKERESVALGVRLYEESKEPNAHASDGKLKSPTHIRAAIERIRTLRPLSQFFCFLYSSFTFS